MKKRNEPLTVSIREYFFKDGDMMTLRRETVTRDELWAILSWHEKRTRARRSLWGRLKRAVRNVPDISPFDWARAQRRKP